MRLIPDSAKFHNFSVIRALRFSTLKFLVTICLPTAPLFPTLAQAQVKRSRVKAIKTSPCSFHLNGSPDVKGLKLGMTETDFLKTFPSAKDTSADFETEVGEKSFLVNSKENPGFAGVDVTAVKFVDGGLSFLSLTYTDFETGGGRSIGVAALMKQTTNKLNLPPAEAAAGWQSDGKAIKVLNCQDFSITISSGDYGFRQELPSLLLKDKMAFEKVAARRKALAERRLETEKGRKKVEIVKRSEL